MTKREQIIEILEIWYDYIINDGITEDIADAILALPLDVPSEDEIKEMVGDEQFDDDCKDAKGCIIHGVKWAIDEIKRRNNESNT